MVSWLLSVRLGQAGARAAVHEGCSRAGRGCERTDLAPGRCDNREPVSSGRTRGCTTGGSAASVVAACGGVQRRKWLCGPA